MPEFEAMKTSIAELPELASHFYILTAPAILLFYQGKEVERFARFVPQATLTDILQKWREIAEYHQNH